MVWFASILLACKPPVSATPEWHPNTGANDAIYFVLVDRFADGDIDNNAIIDRTDPQGWHGGDIQGILNNLDH